LTLLIEAYLTEARHLMFGRIYGHLIAAAVSQHFWLASKSGNELVVMAPALFKFLRRATKIQMQARSRIFYVLQHLKVKSL